MTFAAARSATGAIRRRALRFGAAIPVMESFLDEHSVSNTFTVSKPSGTLDGETLVISATHYTDQVLTQVTGGWIEMWAHLLPEGSRETCHHGFYRVVQAGDTTWDFSYGGSNRDTEITTIRISGAAASNPVIAFNSKGTTGSSTEIVIPAVSSDITNCLLLHFVGKSDVLSGTITPPGNGETVILNDDNGDIQHLAAHEPHIAGGGTGTRTYGMSNSVETNFGGLVLIQPPEGIPSHLLLEDGTNRLLFEDSSGILRLE